MNPRIVPYIVVAVVFVGGGIALFRGGDAGAAAPASTIQPQAPAEPQAAEPPALPPNHPPIPSGGSPHGSMPVPTDESAAIAWTAPSTWTTEANPNSMRLATYSVPGGAEVSVARAGGTTEANIQRWLAQFDGAGAETRTEKTVRGLHATVVEVAGTYQGMGGMGGGPGAGSHPGWALLGAIVETKGSPYFFKMIGPAPAVKAAHASFDALLGSITPH